MITEQMVQVRWMVRADLARVLQFDAAAHEVPWGEDDYLALLRQRNAIAMVADDIHRNELLGVVAYELFKDRMHIRRLCVDPLCQRQGVGTALITRLIYKLSQQRRRHIDIEVSEWNDGAHWFLKALGFQAMSVLRGCDVTDDMYSFRYSLGDEHWSVG